MAESEDKPSLHIDLDWKKQAQEEKKRLEEEEKKRAAEREARQSAAPIAAVPMASNAAPPGMPQPAASARGKRGQREIPPASIPTLVQSMVTQTLFYLGELATPGAEPTINMDMARHQLDTLGLLEEKTQGNLNEEEKQYLDTALYEVRTRFISVAGQIINGQ